MEGNPDSGTQEIFAWGTRNSGIFSCGIWNQGLWDPEYSLRNPESHLRLESRIQVPLIEKESEIQNLESRIQYCLGFPITWGKSLDFTELFEFDRPKKRLHFPVIPAISLLALAEELMG